MPMTWSVGPYRRKLSVSDPRSRHSWGDDRVRPGWLRFLLAGVTAGSLVLSGCTDAGPTDHRDPGTRTITALMVANPQMADIQRLTAEHFTKRTGITVQFTVLAENELRDRVTEDVESSGGRYDVATVGAYEVPIW